MKERRKTKTADKKIASTQNGGGGEGEANVFPVWSGTGTCPSTGDLVLNELVQLSTGTDSSWQLGGRFLLARLYA